MITYDTHFNFDSKKWRVHTIISVQYVSYQGYVVTVAAYDADEESHMIDLLANATPIGYSKI